MFTLLTSIMVLIISRNLRKSTCERVSSIFSVPR